MILRFYHRRRDEGDTEGRDHRVDDRRTTDHHRLTAFAPRPSRPRNPIRTDRRRPSRFADETRMTRISLDIRIVNSWMRSERASEIFSYARSWGSNGCIRELTAGERRYGLERTSLAIFLFPFSFLYYVVSFRSLISVSD